MESDLGGPGVLTEEKCLARLAANQLGRVGVVMGGQPLVFPVNYVLDGRTIVFRTGAGTILGGASFAMVAFEIDGSDPVRRSGWSVMVQGMGHDITDAADELSQHLQTIEVFPWAPGSKPRLLRIDPRVITGRLFNGPPAGDRPQPPA
ncbi:MAG: pyridoxamine 5'-phosphate oxidase family protein [Acidimicrobiales bacterium]